MKLLRDLLWCLFNWREQYPSWEELIKEVSRSSIKKRVVMITHDIGLCQGNTPGKGNMLMAEQLVTFQNLFPTIPILAQLGVAMAANQLGVKVDKTIGPPTIDTALNKSTLDYNSKTVVFDQKFWLKANKMWPNHLAVVLTSPDHVGRVVRIMQKQGFENILCLPLPSLKQRDYLDETSLYWSMRIGAKIPGGGSVYRAREFLGRILFLKNGWM